MKRTPALRTGIRLWTVLLVLGTAGCRDIMQLDTYEKHVAIPGYSWQYDFHPAFDVRITDTAARYNIEITLRHTDAYPFANLWILVSGSLEGEKPAIRRVELPLADRSGQWLGSGMDDIYEHRIPIQRNARFDKAGIYHFSFEQNMRVNPLAHVMSIGLRIEKVPR